MSSNPLTDRSLNLLNILVERYIRDGVPVGSTRLAQDGAVALSSASIRNVMADLEEAGYLRSPHTSAGRVPTDKAYRLFVDSVLTTQLSELKAGSGIQVETFTDSVKKQLENASSTTEMVESASGILSELTSQVGLVLLPKNAAMSFRHLEFLPLSSNRVLVIIVLNEGEVQNRIIHTSHEYSERQLQKAASFVNEHFAGQPIDNVKDALVSSMREDKSLIDKLMQDAIDLAGQALDDVGVVPSDYVVAGQANLLDENVDDMRCLKELFEAFQQKKDILHLMERCTAEQGIHVFIGAESGYDVLGDFSVVTAPYESSGNTLGVLGVIGPTRMAYDRVVPMVDVTAKLLSAALKS